MFTRQIAMQDLVEQASRRLGIKGRAGLLRNRQAEEASRSRGGGDQPKQHPDRRRFARTVGAEEAVNRPCRNGQINPIDGVL